MLLRFYARIWAGKGNIYEKEEGYDSFVLDIGKVFIGNDTEDSVVVRSRNLPLEVIFYRRHRGVMHGSNTEKYFKQVFPLFIFPAVFFLLIIYDDTKTKTTECLKPTLQYLGKNNSC